MEACYNVYTWLCRTLVAIMLQFFWKMQQISDYFNNETPKIQSKEDPLPAPLTKDLKARRHIRSMSDVRSGTPHHLIPMKAYRRGSNYLMYDSDTRIRRHRLQSRYRFDSTDSSDTKRSVENNIVNCLQVSDSMRYL